MSRPRSDRDRLRDATDRLAYTMQRLGPVMHRLLTRAEIPPGPDGYPTRASTATGTATLTRRTPEPRLELHGHRLAWTCPVCGLTGLADTEGHARDAHHQHHRTEHGLAHTVADPTGDAAATRTTSQPHDPVAADVHRLVRQIETAAARLAATLDQAQRIDTTRGVGEPDDIWCRNHLDHGMMEPIATRPDGTRRYRDLCRWCGEYRAEHSHEPDRRLLQIRVERGSVTQADVDAELARHRQRKTTTKKRAKR